MTSPRPDRLPAAATQYIVRRRKPKVAHIWTGEDTRCRMASTGGLDPANYSVVSDPGLPVCAMCAAAEPSDGSLALSAS